MIIAVANQKGGAGKSTTATALAAALTLKKRKTLIIDMDSQGNTSGTCAAQVDYDEDGNNITPTVFELLYKRTAATKMIQPTASHGDIIPSSLNLSSMDNVLTATGKEQRLKKALEPIVNDYDHIIIDTAHSLGILTINALTAADGVIIPSNADKFGYQGIMQTYGQIESVLEFTNPKLKVFGILLTRHTPRQLVSSQYAEGFVNDAKRMKTIVFKTYIRECAAIRQAQALQKSIFEYAPDSSGAADYTAFVDEFLTLTKGKRYAH